MPLFSSRRRVVVFPTPAEPSSPPSRSPPLFRRPSSSVNLVSLIASGLRSPEQDDVLDALDALTDALGRNELRNTTLCKELRAAGVVQQLLACVSHPEPYIAQQALAGLGNLCSLSVDPGAKLTHRLLQKSDFVQPLLRALGAADRATCVYAAALAQNASSNLELAQMLADAGAVHVLELVIAELDVPKCSADEALRGGMGPNLLLYFAAGALQNICDAPQQLIERLARSPTSLLQRVRAVPRTEHVLREASPQHNRAVRSQDQPGAHPASAQAQPVGTKSASRFPLTKRSSSSVSRSLSSEALDLGLSWHALRTIAWRNGQQLIANPSSEYPTSNAAEDESEEGDSRGAAESAPGDASTCPSGPAVVSLTADILDETSTVCAEVSPAQTEAGHTHSPRYDEVEPHPERRTVNMPSSSTGSSGAGDLSECPETVPKDSIRTSGPPTSPEAPGNHGPYSRLVSAHNTKPASESLGSLMLRSSTAEDLAMPGFGLPTHVDGASHFSSTYVTARSAMRASNNDSSNADGSVRSGPSRRASLSSTRTASFAGSRTSAGGSLVHTPRRSAATLHTDSEDEEDRGIQLL
mmetsp:Transcript_19874/g.60281  ORF Transcript_19874/g.60281 Transcript_19874/m.60281 type:complete len:583 (-) Transcript_19874:196-1944(-)